MTPKPTPDEAIARARALQDERITVIRSVAEARQKVDDVREQTTRELSDLQERIAQRLGEAEGEDARAYAAALSAGWTPEEMRRIGFTEPAKKARVRRRATQRTARRDAATKTSPPPEPTSETANSEDHS